MTRREMSKVTAVLLALTAVCVSTAGGAERAGDTTQASQAGQSKQFGGIKGTLESFSFQGANADVILRMDNLADEEKSIAFLSSSTLSRRVASLATMITPRPVVTGPLPQRALSIASLRLSSQRRRNRFR